MDERRLRYFLAVADEGAVTRAANRLRIAQPSLSQALRALEAELGAKLFDRVGRGIRVTAAGRQLVGPARQVLRAMDEARDAVASVSELRAGTLELASLPTLAVDPMASLIGRFRERYPGVRVQMQEAETLQGVLAMVGERVCELGATHLPLHGEGLRAEGLRTHPLGEQELLFILPPGSHAGQPLRAGELVQVSLVVSPPGTSTRILLEEALGAVGVTPRIAVETAAREAIVPLVLAGAGASLLPAPLAREAGRRGAVVRGARPAITRRIGLVYRDASLSPAARAFLDSADD
jgi:LysR family carnitine catabolism transcriptional activator